MEYDLILIGTVQNKLPRKISLGTPSHSLEKETVSL